jgi:REP element-mobilizing transposase RayT
MRENNDIRHGRHSVFMMHVHLVFVTKYRREDFTKGNSMRRLLAMKAKVYRRMRIRDLFGTRLGTTGELA